MSFLKSLFGKKKETPAKAPTATNGFVMPNGDTYNGEWQNGVAQGIGEYTFATGERYVGEFVNGIISGQGRFYYNNGCVYDGHFAKGKRDGSGTMTYPNGDRYEGSWIADRQTGYGKMYYADGRVYRGQFCNDKMTDGFMTVKNENGVWQEIRYGTEVDYSAEPVAVLVSCPYEKKILAIKEVREITSCGLAHAKDIVEHLPQLLKTRVTPEDVEDIRARLEPLGAVVEVRGSCDCAAPSLFSLALISYPDDRKLGITRVIKDTMHCSLAEAKEISENLPQIIVSSATEEAVVKLQKEFEYYGAVIEIK